MKRHVTQYSLYSHRYAISYVLAAAILATVLVLAALYVPSGLRSDEMSGALTSGTLAFQDFKPASVVNLPYHVLQRASMAVFGVSELTLKLPSLILGISTVVGMFLLLKEWFRRNVAVITVLLTATIPGFIFIAQDATAQIYPVAISIWLLLIATYVSRRREPHVLWKILFFVLLALNMYTPLGIYLNIAILSTIIFHPHIRYLSRSLNPNRIVIAVAVGLIILAPLLYSVVMQPMIGLQLLGIPEATPDFKANAISLAQSYFWQTGDTNAFIHPMFPLGILLLMIIGFIRFVQVKYTARSYIIWLWGIALLPLLLVNPQLAVLILPLAMLMIAMGINTLIAEWYKLFPYNPYARIVGLIPLSIIVFGIAVSGISRYALNYHYNPTLLRQFSNDTRLLKQVVTKSKATTDQPINVIVSSKQKPFLQLVANYDRRFVVNDNSSSVPYPYVVSHDAHKKIRRTTQPSYIAVSSRSEAADRFYLYTEPRK